MNTHNTHFKFTDSALSCITQSKLGSFQNSKAMDFFDGSMPALQKIDLETIDKIIDRAKGWIFPIGIFYLNIPNWNRGIQEIINDTEVWFVTDDDAKNNLSLNVFNRFEKNFEQLSIPSVFGNSSFPDLERQQEIIKKIQQLESQYLEVLETICVFIIYVENYINFLHENKIQEDNNDLVLIREILSSLESICPEVLNERIDSLIEDIDSNYYVCSFDTEMIQKILSSFSSVKIREGWNGEEDLSRLYEQIKKIKNILEDSSRLSELKKELEDERKKLWGDGYKSKTDWLGCYCPKTGTIFIKIDKVKESSEIFSLGSIELWTQKVLIHEFIHAAFDLWIREPDGTIGKYDFGWEKDDLTEEALDNAIVLWAYENNRDFTKVGKIVANQPYYYQRGFDLYVESFHHPTAIFASLIEYKLFQSAEN